MKAVKGGFAREEVGGFFAPPEGQGTSVGKINKSSVLVGLSSGRRFSQGGVR